MDDDFEPHPGRIGSRDHGVRYLNMVLQAKRRAGGHDATRGRRFDGGRIGRGGALARVLGSGDRHAAFRARRVIVKTRLIRLVGKGGQLARAHQRYIERDGVTRDGAPGQLYARDTDAADGKAFQAQCKEDRHQFRLIVSAEDGDQYEDLRPLVRKLMAQMEEDLGTQLDWVAVDHFNTGHPHTHIVLRGKDDRGEDLIIAREYISAGLRERAARIVTLDLGPRTDLEIEARQRHDVDAERLTPLDRRLLRDMASDRSVAPQGRGSFDQALRNGRLRKLSALGLATDLGEGRWRLADGMERTLRQMGERGDIIRTLQRELRTLLPARAVVDQHIYDPQADGATPLVGRLVGRGLADEIRDRHYLIVDGIDGRAHYADVGADILPMNPGAVVRVTSCEYGIRDVDQTIVAVATANGGVYTPEAHRRHDPSASESFAQTHVRRLEALRRARAAEREVDGRWIIPADHLEKVAAVEARYARERPVTVEVLSALPIERLTKLDAATWLDREMVGNERLPVRDAAFGQELRNAQAVRRQWLVDADLAMESDGKIRFRRDFIDQLRRRELLRVAARLTEEIGKPFSEVRIGERVEGRLNRPVEMVSGRHALIERARDFTLVPWREVLEPSVGQGVFGIMREGGINWQFGRQRAGPTIA